MSLGLCVMINMLSSNEETVNAIKNSIGKEIKNIIIEDNILKFNFSDETTLDIWDDGQSCCETRYMNCDDDLKSFVGETIVCFELKDSTALEKKYSEHEIQFLEIKTNKSVISISNHNEHNGYYGGFSIKAKNY